MKLGKMNIQELEAEYASLAYIGQSESDRANELLKLIKEYYDNLDE